MEKKIVLITGASSGIGEGCARKFAMNGYRLILNGRNVEKLTAVKRELETEYHADVYYNSQTGERVHAVHPLIRAGDFCLT